MSERLAGVGENIAISPSDRARVFVPQPARDRIVGLDLPELTSSGPLAGGHEPSYVSVDAGSRVLLAISEDGTAITSVDLHNDTKLPDQSVPAGPGATVDGPERGRLIDYHVTGPGGIIH